MAKTTITTITINGTVYEGKVDLVMSLITSGLLTEVAEQKPVAKKTSNKGKKSEAKAEEKAETVTIKVAEPQTDDKFDYAQYIEVAKGLKVMGEKVPYKWARKTIYKVMNGELTMVKASKELVKIAEKNPKLAYYLKAIA